MNKKTAIYTKNLTRKFGDFTAVDSVTLEVNKGEIFGFLGANGAGKTTAIRMLTGLLLPTSGEASIVGFDVASEPQSVRKKIGYMSQRFSLYEDLTVWENIRFYGGVYGLTDHQINEKSVELLETLNMQNVRSSRIGALPLGWKQKLAF